MKKGLIIGATILVASCSNAQNSEKSATPQVVKDAFTSKFTTAEHSKWDKEGENYEVEFKEGNSEYSALYDVTGKLLELEQEIEINQLPESIAIYVAQHYPKAKINEAAKITDYAKTVTYEAEIKGKDLIFSEDGKFIKEIED